MRRFCSSPWGEEQQQQLQTQNEQRQPDTNAQETTETELANQQANAIYTKAMEIAFFDERTFFDEHEQHWLEMENKTNKT